MQRLATPIAILVGSAMIALGLYFGLRERLPGDAPVGATASASSVAASVTPSAAAPPVLEKTAPPVAAAPSIEPRTLAEADAQKAVASLGQTIRTQCFDPHKSDPGAPRSVKFTYSGGFDANGVEIARALSEDRAARLPAISQCARELPMTLRIAPPGTNVNVTLVIEVP